MNRTIVEHNGCLAAALPAHIDWHRPVQSRYLAVSNLRVTDDRLDRYLGKSVADHGNGGGYVYWDFGQTYVDWHDWAAVTVETPIPAPRNGKTYTWQWSGGEWVKQNYDRCDNCRKYHDPAILVCEHCGDCHKVDSKAIYCETCCTCHKPGSCRYGEDC